MLTDEHSGDDRDIENQIENIKQSLGIDKPNADMSPEEIQAVTRQIAEHAPDTTYDQNGEPVFGPEGMKSAMSVASYFIFVVFDGR